MVTARQLARATLLALALGAASYARQSPVLITTPDPLHQSDPAVSSTLTCFVPSSGDSTSPWTSLPTHTTTEVSLRTDPRHGLLSDDILLCELQQGAGTGDGRDTAQRMYAVLGTVMLPHDSSGAAPIGGDALALETDALQLPPPASQPSASSSDPLLSFDEWKEQYLEHARKAKKDERARERSQRAESDASSTHKSVPADASSTRPAAPPTGPPVNASDARPAEQQVLEHAMAAAPAPPTVTALEDAAEELSELKHRWNYASLDCAAVVHQANPEAKFPSAILSEKKDRYMLSPCPSSRGKEGSVSSQFVIVELCQQIRIDTMVLANLEFFSSMFKLFSVRVARSLHAPETEWHTLGMFRARNVRGPQVFKMLSTPHTYYRFMRIDFLEHYGSEYYCPVSILRVYGRNEREDADEDILSELQAADDDDDDVAEEEEACPGVTLLDVHGRWVEEACTLEPFPGVWACACLWPEAAAIAPRPTPASLLVPPLTQSWSNHTLDPRDDGTLAHGSQEDLALGMEHADTIPTKPQNAEAPTTKTPARDTSSAAPTMTSATSTAPATAAETPMMSQEARTGTDASAMLSTCAVPARVRATSSLLSDMPVSSEPSPALVQPPIPASSTSAQGSSFHSATPTTLAASPAPSARASLSSAMSVSTSDESVDANRTMSHAESSEARTRSAETKSSKSEKPKSTGKPPPASEAKSPGSGGESIYRTITKRLSALESNTSLSMQFLQLNSEQLRDKLTELERTQTQRLQALSSALDATHTRVVREALSEQGQVLQRAMAALATQQRQHEAERALWHTQFERLARDVRVGKRWDTVQLLLLLLLLLMLVLTRSSPAQQRGEERWWPDLLRARSTTPSLLRPPMSPPHAASPDTVSQLEDAAAEFDTPSAWRTSGSSVLAVPRTPRQVASLKYPHRRGAYAAGSAERMRRRPTPRRMTTPRPRRSDDVVEFDMGEEMESS